MKVTGIISAAALSLLLGIAAPALARQETKAEQQDHPKEQKSAPKEQKNAHEQGRPEQQHAQQSKQSEEKRSPAGKSESQQERTQQDQHARQQARPETKPPQVEQTQREPNQKNHPRNEQQNHEPAQAQAKRGHGDEYVRPTQEQQRVQQSTWQEHRSRNWESDHRTWAQRGGYHGYRIPDDHYRGYFGPEHSFRIYGLPFMVEGGYPRFQYGGYWFSPVDPWPEYWASDWYNTDEVYVTYVDNGYYMYNRRYPTVGIAINITN